MQSKSPHCHHMAVTSDPLSFWTNAYEILQYKTPGAILTQQLKKKYGSRPVRTQNNHKQFMTSTWLARRKKKV
ncbi:hypothetical protein JCM16163A_32240 [Paenibacillus sp. YK5]